MIRVTSAACCLQVDGSNENGFGEQHPSLATVRGLLANAHGRRLVIHNGDISYARQGVRAGLLPRPPTCIWSVFPEIP